MLNHNDVFTRTRFVLLLAVVCTNALVISVTNSNAQQISKEGQRKLAKHNFLFDEFLEGRATKYQGKGDAKALKELTIFEETHQINDGYTLNLPRGCERIAGLFRHFGFKGEDLDRIKEVHVAPFSPQQAPPRSVKVKDFYRVQMPSIPLSDKPFEPMTIIFYMKNRQATCRIDNLTFIAQKAIPPAFDDIPYRDLGSEFPRERVEVSIDTDNELVIGGTSELERDRWFRIHETPGIVDHSFEKYALERGFFRVEGP